jgi:signal transduction histidine kinase
MRSLGARLAALLVAAIVAVVAISSFAAWLVLRGPRAEMIVEPVARELLVLLAATERNKAEAIASGVLVSTGPAVGTRDGTLSDFLTDAMRRVGGKKQVVVSRETVTAGPIASVRLEDGDWILVSIPSFGPPPGGLVVLAGWLTLIVIGTAVVSVAAASKITKPLRLLEHAAGEVGPDGTLPLMPESGPVEVRATARALNRLSARLRIATESRMRLVAAAGHDLRTPMTRMRLRAEFISDGLERQKWLADLEELDQIADSAIGLVREEVSHDSLQEIRLDRTIVHIVEGLVEIGLDVTTAELQPAVISAAPLATTRALRNLLINAATHGRSAVVAVTGVCDTVVVRIEDCGPGIPEDRLDQVFEPFFRIDNGRQKSRPGAGLGMAIAKEIISRFEGEIFVRNRRPAGLEQIIIFKNARFARAHVENALPSERTPVERHRTI